MSFAQNATKTFPSIICVGKNYLKHVKQMGGSQIPTKPVLFMKPWSSLSLNPSKLQLRTCVQNQVDHQLQLGVYIGKGGRDISKQRAMEHVGGYFLGIDFSDRVFQNQAKKAGLPWCLAKCQDNFCPITSLFTQPIDPYSVQLQMKVNGQTKQKAMTSQMHFKIDTVISYISKYITLSEGDLIMTGTPDGVGPVTSGDRVEAYGRVEGRVVGKLEFVVSQ